MTPTCWPWRIQRCPPCYRSSSCFSSNSILHTGVPSVPPPHSTTELSCSDRLFVAASTITHQAPLYFPGKNTRVGCHFLLRGLDYQWFFHLWSRDSPGGPVVKNLPSHAGDAGSISGQGTKIHVPRLRPDTAKKIFKLWGKFCPTQHYPSPHYLLN